MTDILDNPFDPFADAVEASLEKFREEIRSLRSELDTFKTEQRSAPAFTIPAPIPGKDGENGKDGRGIARFENRSGVLIAHFSDNTEQEIGRFVGENGKDGRDGKDGVGTDGKDGRDGKDGERGADGIPSIEEVESVVARAVGEIQVRSLIDTYRDVYAHGQTYTRGATATWDGSLWLALRDTAAQPGTQDSGWKMITKRGRDGRDARK